ncbi:unnamed protein product [Mytilus coruscus]|uniref:Uncharacterized protein n=1 Tax=Mytilus coruscus TaxID=42192 RepID=A0A6J8BLT5_MYTCO|nr:unnamed protein product [Mytilus coruscus]
MSWSGEGEQTMQMLSNNNRSNNRTNAVPFILQQTQRPGNISLSNYQNPVDMDNQYKRLDFTMQNDEHKSLKEVHNDYSMHYYKGTGSPAVNNYGSKFSKKARLSERTNDLKEVHNNYSLPYDSITHPPVVNNDDTKQNEFKAGPSVTTKDIGHEHVSYCDTAIVHEDFLYDIPKHSNKSLDNRCSVKK